jgi:hypothetical protein
MPVSRVHVLVLPAVNLLDLSGPVQVLHTANHYGGAYEIGFVAAAGQERSAQGLALAALAPLPRVAAGDVVLVPGPISPSGSRSTSEELHRASPRPNSARRERLGRHRRARPPRRPGRLGPVRRVHGLGTRRSGRALRRPAPTGHADQQCPGARPAGRAGRPEHHPRGRQGADLPARGQRPPRRLALRPGATGHRGRRRTRGGHDRRQIRRIPGPDDAGPHRAAVANHRAARRAGGGSHGQRRRAPPPVAAPGYQSIRRARQHRPDCGTAELANPSAVSGSAAAPGRPWRPPRPARTPPSRRSWRPTG